MAAHRKGPAAILAASALCAGMAAVTLAAPPAGAVTAASVPLSVGITVTPGKAAVGDSVTVVATATNNTDAAASGALGIDNPDWANQHITAVSGSRCTPRNVTAIIYCGTNLAPGATASITVTLTTTAAGTDDFRAYARQTGIDNVYAYATLTVS